MQSGCSPIARCWGSMYNITFKGDSGLGVLVTPHLVHPYSSPTATQQPCLRMVWRVTRGEDLHLQVKGSADKVRTDDAM